ncbi:hypothetical protein JL721_3274 [Aureococcus anophagefferens]|nr:hypothetical protein JL721_3274 [Aureococcus anophagefferens]
MWKRAAELGNVEAMRHLGKIYWEGSGVKLDKKKAERLVRMAAVAITLPLLSADLRGLVPERDARLAQVDDDAEGAWRTT